jgi:hypothetical protein
MGKACEPEEGFRFIINSNDHPPPHVHVYKGGDLAIFYVGGAKLWKNFGMSIKDRNRAKAIIGKRQKVIRKKWEEIHGSRPTKT